MDVEVEVVRCVRATYLVRDVRSLEAAEREALALADKKLAGTNGATRTGVGEPETFVQWSRPVIVRDGKVLDEPD